MVTLLNTVEDKVAKEICSQHGDKSDQLLEILHAVQTKSGFLSDEALRTIAYALNISRAEIHGVVSFYHDFKRQAGARQIIKICRAEACQAMGADELITKAETEFAIKIDEPAKEVALEATYCLGNCALGPAVMIDHKLYGRVTAENLRRLSLKHFEGSRA